VKKRRHGVTNSIVPVKGAMKKLEDQDQRINPQRYSAPALPKNAKVQHFPS
jgi:hypothetical protein